MAKAGMDLVSANPPVLNHFRLELGVALRIRHDFDNAMSELVRARDYFTETGEHGGHAHAAIEIGLIHRSLGDLDDSRESLLEAIEAAERVNDLRTVRRASREAAITLRHEGKTQESIVVLTELVDMEPPGGHALANVLNDLATSQMQVNDLDGAQANFQKAADLYAIHGDMLGNGNVERALGSIAAQLSRYSRAREHFELAITHYANAGYDSSIANARRELALVELAQGDPSAAMRTALLARYTSRRLRDDIGESGALRAIAQCANALNRPSLCRRALDRSLILCRRQNIQLGIANTLLHIAGMTHDHNELVSSALEATALYEELDIPAGIIQALSHLIAALPHDDNIEDWCNSFSANLVRTSHRIRSGTDRADFGNTAFQARSRVLTAIMTRGDQPSTNMAARLITDSNSGALTELMRLPVENRLSDELQALIKRTIDTSDHNVRRGHLNRIASMLTESRQHHPVEVTNPGDKRHDIAITIGPPSIDGGIPILWTTADSDPAVALVPMSADIVDVIDELGSLSGESFEELELLWSTNQTQRWQQPLADLLLPHRLREQLLTTRPLHVLVDLHQSINHLPIEALLVNGEPFGAQHIIERRLGPATNDNPATKRTNLAFADPLVPTQRQRHIVGSQALAPCPEDLQSRLGPAQDVWICAHGRASSGLGAVLETSAGELVIDAAHILNTNLTGSNLVLESCWTGRQFGRPHSERLSLVTAALLSGAESVAAGLFPLPVSQTCTGALVSLTLEHLSAGLSLPEALHAARRTYLFEETAPIDFESPNGNMPLSREIPLLWAGLVAYR